MAERSKSPWVWVGCGCAAIAGLGLVVIGVLAFFGIQTARTMADPEARATKSLQILSAGTIPPGYDTELAMSVPFFADIVVLEGDARQFVFLKGLRSKASLAAAFDDDDSLETQLRRAGLRIGRRQQILARGALPLAAAEARYLLVDGKVRFDASGRSNAQFDFDDEDFDAEISAVLVLRCSAEEEPGVGVWAGPRAEPDADPEDTTADQAALLEFLEGFNFCVE